MGTRVWICARALGSCKPTPVISTLPPAALIAPFSATPLDGRDQRMAMYHTISDALRDDGVYVGGVEHDDLTRRLLGLPIARRVRGGRHLY